MGKGRGGGEPRREPTVKLAGAKMIRKVNNMVEPKWLDPPEQYYHRWMGIPIELEVVGYELGLQMRNTSQPPGKKVLQTMRLHLTRPPVEGYESYLDFSHRGLIWQIMDIYAGMIKNLRRTDTPLDAGRALAVLPEGDGFIRLRLTRSGEQFERQYVVEVLE